MSADNQTAMAEIEAERRRQIEVEGWTHKHDDEHDRGEMLRAAVIYYQHGKGEFLSRRDRRGTPLGWPWDPMWWKPKDPRRDLIRAGALCLAEKERLTRKYQVALDMHATLIREGATIQPAPRLWVGHVDQKLGLIVGALAALDSGIESASVEK